MPVLLISAIEEVDPSHQVRADVHVQQQVPPSPLAVLQLQEEVVEAADIGILLQGDQPNVAMQSLVGSGDLLGIGVEGDHG